MRRPPADAPPIAFAGLQDDLASVAQDLIKEPLVFVHQRIAGFGDYPLRQAIRDNIVKRPVKGITDIGEMPSADTAIKYEPFIIAGIERWRENPENFHAEPNHLTTGLYT